MAKNGIAANGSKLPNHKGARLSRKPQRLSLSAAPPRTITVRVPLAVGRRGGRKLVLTPNGTPHCIPNRQHVHSTIIKALARAQRWKQMLESGKYASVTELAAAEKINDSYLCRMLRLTLLAPDLVGAALDGRLNPAIEIADLLRRLPAEWDLQRTRLAASLQ
jgi:hypothetical protein